MRKDRTYKSRSKEARNRRRIERSTQMKAATKGKKTHACDASDPRNENRPELGKGEEFLKELRRLAQDTDPRVRLPALKLLLEYEIGKPVQPSDAPSNNDADAYTGPVELITDPVEASRVYQDIIQGKRPSGSVRILSPEFEGERADAMYEEMVEAGEVDRDDVPPELRAEAKRAYLRVLGFRGRDLGEAPAAPQPPVPTPPRPKDEVSRSASLRPPADVESNVIVLEQQHQGECQPIVDSKCAFCRQLWVKEREAAEDARLRVMRPPLVIT